MDDTAQFVSDLNVGRFADRLRFEHNPAIRASLQRLLLEEEDKLGYRVERLGNVQRHISEGGRRIAMQKALIAKLMTEGQDVTLAESMLSKLVEIQKMFEQYRQIVLDAIDRNHRNLG
jgi:hypothetical protein